MKNPDNKPLRIYTDNPNLTNLSETDGLWEWQIQMRMNYGIMLSNLAIAESNLVKAGKDSAMPHFLAIVKELERLYRIEFRIVD